MSLYALFRQDVDPHTSPDQGLQPQVQVFPEEGGSAPDDVYDASQHPGMTMTQNNDQLDDGYDALTGCERAMVDGMTTYGLRECGSPELRKLLTEKFSTSAGDYFPCPKCILMKRGIEAEAESSRAGLTDLD